jgi:cation-transporting ATPase 13A1
LKGVLSLAASPVNLPLRNYLTSKGLKNELEVSRAMETWGNNHLSLPTPSFVELLRQQLLSPLAIFQIFCALLWLLDEYWTYTLWTLCSVLIFEAMTVFQRTKTLNMLGGMAPKPISVYAFRHGKWTLMVSKDLLPGDLISVSYKSAGGHSGEEKDPNVEAMVASTGALPPGASDVVPCDCLLVCGSAVVNEASLTGESVPQMKEAVPPLSAGSDDEPAAAAASARLDINGVHRVHTLFSGTTLVTVDGVPHDETAVHHSSIGIPPPPDRGAVAYVLRTGFSSSQGALMQMIEFSTQSVSGDSKETGLALLLLLFFALIASAYVLKEGLRKKEKTTHEILLKCVIIITSVVPRQLPMQMAMAVNMALMALMKSGIFCTEPFRVPLSGKISHCLFDKTGTLTTDQLVPIGVVNVDAGRLEDRGHAKELSPVRDAFDEAAMVLAACHSLVVVEAAAPAAAKPQDEDGAATANVSEESQSGKGAKGTAQIVGDPIELAALKVIDYIASPHTHTHTL